MKTNGYTSNVTEGKEAKMVDKLANNIRSYYYDYIGRFKDGDSNIHPLLQLKLDHSERVAKECKALARDLEWSHREECLAEILGLLHDIGRFPQFAKYHTFSDGISVDHGEEGWRVLEEESILEGLPNNDAKTLLTAVRYHNRRMIPDSIDDEVSPWLKLIRDADKLDILMIVIGAVEEDGFQDLEEMLPGISLDRIPSDNIIAEIREHHSVDIRNVTNLGDFLLLQLSWIYDFNYVPAFHRISERKILEQIGNLIQTTPNVDSLLDDLHDFVELRIIPESIRIRY